MESGRRKEVMSKNKIIGMVLVVLSYAGAGDAAGRNTCPPYKPNCRSSDFSDFNCSSPGLVPCDEANGVKELMHGLNVELSTTGFSRDNCNVSNAGVKIRCSCPTTSLCHITRIYVDSPHPLSGIIPKNVSKLSHLKILDISNNDIDDKIPDSLGNIKTLRYLDLSGNSFSGPIPSSFGNLTSLVALALWGNNVDGNVPESLGNLKNLKYLDLSDNFLRGTIPPSIGNMTSLYLFILDSNFLNGPIPSSLGNLKQLRYLSFFGNKLSGEIPKTLGKLSNLSDLNIEDNELTGNLPSELGDLINLKSIAVSSNKFTGKLPHSYESFSSMEYFDVSGNYLSGPVPNFFSKWENLTDVYLMGNDFEGNLPPEIFEISTLESLWVSDLKNTADFHFPKEANLTNIQRLILRNCSINSHIPEYIGKWSQLSYLDLSFNNLTGSIPDSLEHVSKLRLTWNMLDGHLPSWIYLKTNESDVSYNNFQIQSPIYSNHSTSKPNILPNRNYATKERHCNSTYESLFINCGGNEETDPLDGKTYEEDISQDLLYENLEKRWAYTCNGDFLSGNVRDKTINSSDYLKNKTCGVSDRTIVDTSRICPLALTYYAFCLRNGHYFVKLKFAEIVFSKDQDHSSLGKRVFDIYIQGEKKLADFNIKQEFPGDPYRAVEKGFDAEVKENQLVVHFFWAGKGSVDIDPYLNGPLVSSISVTRNATKKRLSASQIAGITVGCVLLPLLVLAFMWQMGWLGNRELKEVDIEVRGRHFSLKQIIDATRKFSPKMEIGSGRFGVVYKAELPDGIQVAVKKISPDIMQDKLKTELQGEIFNLKSLKHENLIRLYGGYSKKNLHLLIYEYMENGSLHHVILDPKSNVVLDWKVRYDICLGLAKALKHLHEETGIKILHRNIKASNVLLDGSYRAKLTDFGWARLYNEQDPFMALRVGGARVYMAPEYALGQPITDKADVYSYGVLVLEVFCGRAGITDLPNQEAAYLLDDARIAHARGRLDKVVDRKMADYDRKVVFTALNLAVMCIHPTAELRPTMSQIVSVLLNEQSVDQISKAQHFLGD